MGSKLPKVKKGERVELLENLPDITPPLVTAGVFGIVAKVAGGLFRRSRLYTVVVDLGGPNKPSVVLNNVRREQFRPTRNR